MTAPKKIRIIEDVDIGVLLDEESKAKYEAWLKEQKEKAIKEQVNEDTSSGSRD